MKTTYCKMCPSCGKLFETPEHAKVYCSMACRAREGSRREQDKRWRKRQPPTAPNTQLERDVADAERLGMSYGQYKVWCMFGEGRIK